MPPKVSYENRPDLIKTYLASLAMNYSDISFIFFEKLFKIFTEWLYQLKHWGIVIVKWIVFDCVWGKITL